MPDWGSEIRRRLEGSRYAPAAESRLLEELGQHLDDRYAALRAAGVSEEDAIRETLAELDDEADLTKQIGSTLPASAAEDVPLGGSIRSGIVGGILGDLRHGLRLLRRSPVYASAIILTLALGIGANTAVFSIVNAILLRPTPFVDSDRLVVIWETDRNSGTMNEPASWPDIRDFAERSRTVETIGALMGLETTWLVPDGEAERVSALGVTHELPSVLGVRPLAGRLFLASDAAGGEPVALISERFWRSRLGADPDVVGRRLTLDDRPTTVVGVLPAGSDLGITQIHAQADYTAPFAGGTVDVWLGMRPTEEEFPRQTHPLLTIGRLAPGASLEQAQDELAAVAAELEANYPENDGRGVNVAPLDEVIFGTSRPVLLLLLGAVGLVLLVTCANVANLILTRTVSRQRELAIRAALGARSGRIAAQMLSETVVVVALGAAAGLALAYGAMKVLIAAAPEAIPRIEEASMDGRVLLFTAGTAFLVAVTLACLPLLRLRGNDVRSGLQAGYDNRSTEGRASLRVRAGLVVSQTAIAVALTIWAALLVRSFVELVRVDPGFRTAGVLKAEYQLPPTRYPLDFSRWPDLPEINGFNDQLLQRVRALPGVESAAIAGSHPLNPGVTNSFLIVGREGESADLPEIRTRFISPTYGATIGMPVLTGRGLAEGDVAGSAPVGVVNEEAVRRYFEAADPVGQRLRFWGVDWQIVGVVGDERFLGVDREAEPAIYVPIAQAPQGRATLLVHTTLDPMGLVPQIRAIVRDLDPRIALYDVEPLTTTLSESLGRSRFTTLLMTLFGGLAIVLAIVGLHGVLNYTVAQRTPEMGIRLALGASPGRVRRLVIREGMLLTTSGILLGGAAATLGSRFVSGLLFGVSATDSATFLVVAGGTLIAALLACWFPARRATRTDPLLVIKSR